MSAPVGAEPVAIRTPQSHVADLEHEVAELKARVAEMERRLDALTARPTPAFTEPPLPSTAEDVNSVLYPFGLEARRRWL